MARFTVLLLAAVSFMACNQPASKNVKAEETTVTSSSTSTELEKNSVSNNQLIIPGKSIGQTALNDNGADVTRRLGRPDAGDAAMGKSMSVWYANHDSTSYETMIFTSRQMGTEDETSRVKQIRITSPWFVTKDSVKVGSSFEQIEDLYQPTKTAWFKKDLKRFEIYQANGIAFEINNEQKCTAIMVFIPDVKPAGTYLPFYDNLNIY
ncbi:hypothetical protein [uncultured Mucilaginibacter sp.]|uniref:hypothetical protein n=1 Tax=uncultured Mucilaginibacter sp. TaxID=797541 RepID=UPI0025E7AF94|nr:hypothetical protein [uncultured Mucilaginibacter sp.]